MKIQIEYPFKHVFEIADTDKRDRTTILREELNKQRYEMHKRNTPHEIDDFIVEEYRTLVDGGEFWDVAS